ncbi:TonB-dependent receptor plug domain-containing protein [Autumnicola edwardsiae]|uniref:TonB-dependent receptor plug domain-containing protein n=1 Tax=Autumnicola edwardsiae TaxID=3075594 RepID=A0ABU3CY13_9FLAO|nr:TonB-dependent receptor plug domain-containing protein [Zunongwangia sp. F297]MDT0651257.1 TonB-dependent receptor plug domain-containing protein [Zunongwangia sp. F297]
MEEFLTYILKSAVLLAIFYLSYQILLRKDTSFHLNRKFLIGGIFTSFILPAIYFTRKIAVEAPVIKTQFASEMLQNATPFEQETTTDWWYIGGIIYLVTTGIMLSQVVFRLLSILKLISSHNSEETEDFRLIKINRNTGPFSFFRYIVYNPETHSKKDLELILQHEKVHAVQLHSVDILVANFTTAILWFNPFSWWYKKIVAQNLEFLADKETVAVAGSTKAYQHALVKASIPDLQPSLTNNFYQSFIKKRIVMLNKNQNNKPKLWKISLVLPVLISFMFFFNLKTEARFIPKEKNLSEINTSGDSLNTSNIFDKIGKAPLYIINGKEYASRDLFNKHITFSSKLKVLNSEDAVSKYGQKAKDGVIIIPDGRIIDDFSAELKKIDRNKENIDTQFLAINPDYEKPAYISLKKNPGKEMVKPNPSEDNNKIQIVNLKEVTEENQKEPLYILNGVPSKKAIIDTINPERIEKINVLKGKKATALYGTSAKHGAVLITTKMQPEAGAKVTIKSLKSNSGKAEEISEISDALHEKERLIMVNGEIKEDDFNLDSIDPETIERIEILKGESAISGYGERAKDGAVNVIIKGYGEHSTSKAKTISIKKQDNSSIRGTGEKSTGKAGDQQQEKPLTVLNGKVMPDTYNYNDLEPSEIASINVLKGAAAITKYGDKGKNGVIEIFGKGYIGETASPVESNLWYINAKYSNEALNSTKAALKEKKNITVNFSGIERNSDGLITEIKITAETADGKKASATFNRSQGIPDVVVGLKQDGSIIISSNKKDWHQNSSK